MNLRKSFAAYLAVSLIGCLDESTVNPSTDTPTLGQTATAAAPTANVPNAALPGKAIYDRSCAMCHAGSGHPRKDVSLTPNAAQPGPPPGQRPPGH